MLTIKHSRRIAVGIVTVAALGLTGCETAKNYDEQIAQLGSQISAHDARMVALESKATEHDGRIGAVEKGKFNYTKVGETALLFDTGSYTLKPEEAGKLDAAFQRLTADNKSAYIEVEGFADLRGNEKSNRELGLRRAREVYNYLRDKGVALNRMMLFSQGEEHQTDAGLADNRRVVVTVVE